MNIYSIIKLLSLIVHILLSIYAFLKSPRNRLNQSFSLVALSIAIMEFGHFMLLIGLSQAIWVRVAMVGQSLIPVNIILFCLIYGRENYILRTRVPYLIGIYAISLIFIIAFVSGLMSFRFFDKPDYVLAFDRKGWIFVTFLLICTLVALTNLENTYREARQFKKRMQYPTILFIGMLAFHILSYSLALGLSYMRMDILVFASITRIIASIFLLSPVTKPESEGARIYVGRAVIARSYTMLLAGIYLLVIGMLEKIVQTIGRNLNFFISSLIAFSVLLLIMGIIVLKPLKRRFQSFIERNFYKSKYDYKQEWENFSKRVFSILNMKDLLQEILETVSNTIGIDRASIMLLDENRKEFFIAASEPQDGKIQQNASPEAGALSFSKACISADNTFLDWLWRYGSPVRIYNGKCKAEKTFSDPPEVPMQIQDPGLQNSGNPDQEIQDNLCVPIIAENKLIAILILYHTRKKKETYSREDIDLLETMSNQVSIAIMNAKKSQELATARELESFYKLSAMVLHDLKSSASMLSLVVQNAADNFDNPEFQKDALSTISNAVNRIQKLISKLSSTPEGIDFLHLQLTDLNEVVRKAINTSSVKNLSRIEIVEEIGTIPQIMLDPENIERVILNLILNAVESIADSGVITIRTRKSAQALEKIDGEANRDMYAQVSVSDTGCGMPQEFIRYRLFQPFQTTKNKGLGIGLYQCKTIIDAHEGTIDIQSQEGVGSTFTINLPLIHSH